MIGTFPGKLALAEGDEVDVDLEIAGGKLRLTTGVSEIGSWPTESCAITPIGDGYRLTLDGELVSFRPDHPEAFAAVVRGMSPKSTSRSAPLPITDPEPLAGSGYDLEAALDQVLGGSEDDHPAAVFDDSPDDIAVTLEALFATAYPGFEEEEEPEHIVPAPQAVEASTDRTEVSDPGVSQPAEVESVLGFDPDEAVAVPEKEEADTEEIDFTLVDDLDGVAAVQTDEPATVADAGVPTDQSDPFAFETSDVPEPESADAGPMTPAAFSESDALMGTAEDDIEDDLDAVVDDAHGARQPFAASFDESQDADDTDDGDDALDGLAEAEPAPSGFPGSDADRFRPGHFRPGGPAAYDDGDVYHDSPYGGDAGPGRFSPSRPSYPDPVEEHRPAASYGHVDQRPAAGFDLDSAVSGAGYAAPDLEAVEPDEDASVAASGMFSRSASERFASVSGAIRSRLASAETATEISDHADDGLSIADQIVADQELGVSRKGKSFTPELVKKLAIGAVILFVVAGLVLLTPALIRVLVDRIDSPEAVTTVSTAAPVDEDTTPATVTSLPSITDPEGTDLDDGQEEPTSPLLTKSVFSLEPAEFAERWDTVVTSASLEIGAAYRDRTGLGLTQYLGIEWSVGDDGTMESYRVVLDPKGEPRDDELGIAALALAIEVSHPEYEGTDLANVLLVLGLDVEDTTPELVFNEPTVRDGVRYSLVYNADRELVILEVTPASSGPTTSTTTTTTTTP